MVVEEGKEQEAHTLEGQQEEGFVLEAAVFLAVFQ